MILDIIIILALVFVIIHGYKKGLLKTGISAISLLLTMVITLVIYIPVTNIVINTTGIDEAIENAIYTKVMESVSNSENDVVNTALATSVAEGTIKASVRSVAIGIVKLIVFIVLSIIVRLILRCFNGIADLLDKIPGIKGLNHILGAVLNLIIFILAVDILFSVLQMYTTFSPDNGIYKAVDKSSVARFLYNNNIIASYMLK